MSIPKVAIVGDNLEDVYLKGVLENGRFKVKESLEFPGGAGNVFQNFLALLKETTPIAFSPDFYTNYYPLQLFRFITDDTKLMEAYCDPTSERCLTIDVQHKLSKPNYSMLVVADYNKGTANEYSNLFDYIQTSYDVVIVDSRYRSTHPDIIKNGKVKIWRCTGTEWDSNWERQFDWVIWTDGPEAIYLRDPKIGDLCKWDVPQIDPIDTCGAGDTFTAALAAQLLPFSESIKIGHIVHIIPFCIKAAQQVCMKPYTAVWSPNE